MLSASRAARSRINAGDNLRFMCKGTENIENLRAAGGAVDSEKVQGKVRKTAVKKGLQPNFAVIYCSSVRLALIQRLESPTVS